MVRIPQTSISSSPQEGLPQGIVTDLEQLLRIRFWASRINLFAKHLARQQLLGGARSAFRGRGMEFEEVRRYQPGDDIRAIDWKVTARAQGTYTKLFREERERPCHIVVDQRAAMFFGAHERFKSVQAAHAATALAWAALSGGDRIGGQVLSIHGHTDSRAKRSKQAVLRFIHDVHTANQQLLQTITNSQPEASISLSEGLIECQRLIRPGTAVFIVGDFADFDESCAQALVNMAKHADLTLLHVQDNFEENLPVRGRLAISDGQNQASLNFDSDLISAYREQRADCIALLKSAVKRSRARYASLQFVHSFWS